MGILLRHSFLLVAIVFLFSFTISKTYAGPICIEQFHDVHLYDFSSIPRPARIKWFRDQVYSAMKQLPRRTSDIAYGQSRLIPVGEAFEKILKLRRNQYLRLKDLSLRFANEFPNHILNKAFADTLKKIRLDSYSLKRIRDKIPRHNITFYKKRGDNQSLQYPPENYYSHFETLLSQASGAISELVVAFNVKQYIGSNLLIKDIVNTRQVRNILTAEGIPKDIINRFFSLEMDVIFNSGSGWGEVKNFSKIQSTGSNNIRLIVKKARFILDLVRILNEYGYSIQYHLYVIQGGISYDQKKRLINAGIRVH